MPPQARLGDSSLVPADAHGCPACPHTAIGPAIQGSPNVLTNSKPSVRVGDAGVHAACCGPNKWNAKTGSRSVLINGKQAHRMSDFVQHCGGIGNTVQGSPNVIVGDLGVGGARAASADSAMSQERPKKPGIKILLLWPHGEVVPDLPFSLHGPQEHQGTVKNGLIDKRNVQDGSYKIKIEGLVYPIISVRRP